MLHASVLCCSVPTTHAGHLLQRFCLLNEWQCTRTRSHFMFRDRRRMRRSPFDFRRLLLVLWRVRESTLNKRIGGRPRLFSRCPRRIHVGFRCRKRRWWWWRGKWKRNGWSRSRRALLRNDEILVEGRSRWRLQFFDFVRTKPFFTAHLIQIVNNLGRDKFTRTRAQVMCFEAISQRLPGIGTDDA